MKKLLLTVSAVVLGLASEAMADCNGGYMAFRGGVAQHKYSAKSSTVASFSSDGLDSNRLMLAGALGYRYNYYRTELEYVWRDPSEKKISIGPATSVYRFKSYSEMWNNYLDLAPYSWLTPYVGFGLGMTSMKYTDREGSDVYGQKKKTNFTWSVGGGLSVKVTNRFNVDAGYRYYDMGSYDHADITAHEIYGGLRYVF